MSKEADVLPRVVDAMVEYIDVKKRVAPDGRMPITDDLATEFEASVGAISAARKKLAAVGVEVLRHRKGSYLVTAPKLRPKSWRQELDRIKHYWDK